MLYSLTPSQITQSKAEIANYKKVLTEDFAVPVNVFFATLPISKNELDSFIEENPGLTGVRIYFSKKTINPAADDYQLSFVPCMEVTDSNGTYYPDMMEIAPGEPSKIITTACRVPPGCPFGAALLY